MAGITGLDYLLIFCDYASSNSVVLSEITKGVDDNTPNTQLNMLYHLVQSLSIDVASVQQDFVQDKISYKDIITMPKFSMGLFLMSKGTRFPIHDHPNMFAITQILSGRVWYKSYDLVSQNDNEFTYKECFEHRASQKHTFFLTPNYGNLHEIYALEDSIVFDIFMPSYSDNCNYYRQLKEGVFETYNPQIPFRMAQTKLMIIDTFR